MAGILAILDFASVNRKTGTRISFKAFIITKQIQLKNCIFLNLVSTLVESFSYGATLILRRKDTNLPK